MKKLKIRLSEDEVYEIKLPEEIQMAEFQGIVAKFNFLAKNFTRFNIGESQPTEKGEIVITEPRKYRQRDNSKWTFLRDNRNVVIEILKAHWLKTENVEDVFKRYGLNMTVQEVSSNQFKAIREMHKLNAIKDFGMKQFPTKHLFGKSLLINGGGK